MFTSIFGDVHHQKLDFSKFEFSPEKSDKNHVAHWISPVDNPKL
jgi:hypothetical protein